MEGRRCYQRSVRVDKIEPLVWDYVVNLLTGERFEQGLRDAQSKQQETQIPKKNQLELVNSLIAKCESDAKHLVEMKATAGTGGIMERTISEQMAAIDQQYKALLKEKSNTEQTSNDDAITDDQIASALKFRKNVIKGLNEATFEDKRWMLEILRVKVTICDDSAKIQCCIPTAPFEVDAWSSRNSNLPMKGWWCRFGPSGCGMVTN